MKWTIRFKLISSFMLVILLLIATGVVSIIGMNNMGTKASDVEENWLPSALVSGDIRTNVNLIRVNLYRHILEQDAVKNAASEKVISDTLEEQKMKIKELEILSTTEKEQELLKQFMESWTQYEKQIPVILQESRTGDIPGATALANTASLDVNEAYEAMQKSVTFNRDSAKQDITAAVESNETSQVVVIILMIAATVIALVLGLWISQSISRSVQSLLGVVNKVAAGDLREVVEIRTKDEIGQLGLSFNEMTMKLRTLIGKVAESSQSVAAASQQISASSEEIAGGTTTQAMSAQTINELFKELSRAIDSVARSAERAAELSNDTKEGALNGGKVVRASMEGIQQLNKQMALMQDDSIKIGDIIEVINEIAEQTNLLALNAAIEAARAGEQGRGFAVVADEVRKLAERSSSATKQIGAIIRGMQDNTQNSVKALAGTIELSEQTGVSLDHIISKVNETAQQASEIAAASEEQAAQTGEVLHSIESIASASEEAAEAAEETASSSQSLAELAQDLNQAVSLFKF
jgi:methyl-accepting chemotaxis protein